MPQQCCAIGSTGRNVGAARQREEGGKIQLRSTACMQETMERRGAAVTAVDDEAVDSIIRPVPSYTGAPSG